jgi:quinoprotein glucose dehydrogenase
MLTRIARTPQLLLALAAVSAAALAQSAQSGRDWPAYNGSSDGMHASSLTQINRRNVARLTLAWQFDTGEKGGIQTNPLIASGVLYAATPSAKIVALNAATGRQLWRFSSGIASSQPVRGFSLWTSGRERRLFVGIMNFLYCLDARTGQPIASFGVAGRIDLREGLRGDPAKQSIALTTPGAIYKDLIIVGGRNSEAHPAPPGDIRAYDVRTGQLRWSFHTIPHPGEPGYETWPADAWQTSGAANNWAGMTVDTAHGIVYAPTGSAVMDFYGGDRAGDNLYANTLLALDAATGKRLWHFQGVHHDIWDRDFPAAPVLFTARRDGHSIPALAQTTKQGYVYVFNRITGQPLFPIREVPYPKSRVPGEAASPTQPRPDLPAPFARQRLTADDLTNRTPEAHARAAKAFAELVSDGQFVPFSLDKQTIVLPGFDGGAEWGGPAIDPRTNILYVNANEMAWTGGLVPAQAHAGLGRQLYARQCALCHRLDRSGSPPAFPSLLDLDKRMPREKIADVILHGSGRMPGSPSLTTPQLDALISYLRTGEAGEGSASTASNAGDAVNAVTSDKSEMAAAKSGVSAEPYLFTGYRKFLDPDGYPAIAPPWGTLTAIDLNSGSTLWQIPLGQYPALAAKGLPNTGSENYGGPIVTAGGLVFIGATVYDRTFRAFNSTTGKLLWQTRLPCAGVATPSTYEADGRQYVVIAASGGRDPNSPTCGVYQAFALPKDRE